MLNISIRGAAVSTIASVLFFGTIIVATAGMAARAVLSGDTDALMKAIQTTRSRNLYTSAVQPTFESVFGLFYRTTIFALLLMLLYVLEYHPPFPHASRDPEGGFDADYMAFLLVVILLWSLTTIARNDGKKQRPGKKDTSSNSTYKNLSNREDNDTSSITPSIYTEITESAMSKDSTRKTPLESSTVYSLIHGTQDRPQGMMDSASDDGVPSLRKSSPTFDNDSESDTETQMQSENLKETMISPLNDILSKPQSLELKGICEVLFLVLQYTHAKTVKQYSNGQQILHSAFLFLTGFHHFYYFYTTRDYSLGRLLRSFFRINILAIFLCLSQNTSYFVYYVCILHTAYFLLVYFTMLIGSRVSTVVTSSNTMSAPTPSLDHYLSINYSKYGLRFKLMTVGFIIYTVWDTNFGVFQLLHFPFLARGPSIEGAPLGPMWEWYFRSGLHHWMTFIGMIFGANHAIMSLFLRTLEKLSLHVEILAKATIGVALVVALYIWSTGPLQYDRFEFNDINGYFGFIPVLAYIYFRNLVPVLREYSVGAFSKIGQMALEMYLIHHHALLSSNGRTLLILIPGYPKLNLMLVVILYLLISHKFHVLVGQLQDMLLPRGDSHKCLQSMAIIIGLLMGYYFVAFVLDKLGMVTPGTLTALITICGILLYQTLIDTAWDNYRTLQSYDMTEESAFSKISPPLIGVLAVLVLGASWETLAVLNVNSGKVNAGFFGAKPTRLSPSCAITANIGKWIPIDSCSEYHRSISAHRYQVSAVAHCDTASGWAWEEFPAGCRFHHRDSHVLRNALPHRTVVFIGGSITLRLFHGFCRALGDREAGFFGASMLEHSDVARQFGTTSVRFKYAPLASDQVVKLNEFQSTSKEKTPDLVVIGGGVWDVMHLWASKGDPESHKASLRSLVDVMGNLKQEQGIPTVWFIPTTINTVALTNPDKRKYMGETQVEEMRKLYSNLGVYSAADFVVDGRAFTWEKVKESYDGVHYPPYIYDAGAQILANALDWVLSPDYVSEAFDPPQPGSLGNPFLGIVTLCFCFIGLFFFDGYLGFSYLASIFANGSMPSDLYEEALAPLHSKYKLPRINVHRSASRIDDEMLGLISPNKKGIKLNRVRSQ